MSTLIMYGENVEKAMFSIEKHELEAPIKI